MISRIKRYCKDLYGRVVEGRSKHWPAARRAYLKKHPACIACGRIDFVEVHHKVPFHIDPSKELDEDNFATLCENDPNKYDDHLHLGHLGDWKKFNPNVVEDAAKMLKHRSEHKAE